MPNYAQYETMFRNNQFREIDHHVNATKFYYLRSISRSEVLQRFLQFSRLHFDLSNSQILNSLLHDSSVSLENIEEFIRNEHQSVVTQRNLALDELVMQLNRVKDFDWGGSFGNSLEKHIVNNYVKKITDFDVLNEKIESELFYSLRGYAVNSWYNHWSSILIEDIFKSSPHVLPTVGLIKKIDFFINGVPFDLKVTYFPEELMKEKLRSGGFGVELTRIKQICRSVGILIDRNLPERVLKEQLLDLLNDSADPLAVEFLSTLNSAKQKIISDAMSNPDELIVWLYENQGEMRFDATNRFFLILVDTRNYHESWKLKRNLPLLRTEISQKLM